MSLSKPTVGGLNYPARVDAVIDALNALGIIFPFACDTVAIAGATRYLRHGAAETSEHIAYFLCPFDGYVNKVVVQCGTTPGSGETFTITMRKNVADTAMTGQITNGLTSLTLTANAFAVSAGQVISVKLVGSASAASSTFWGSVAVQPFA